MKVSKEQIVALLTALVEFTAGGDGKRLPAARRRLESVSAALALSAASCQVIEGHPESLPILEITVDEQRLGRTAFEICRRLRRYAAHLRRPPKTRLRPTPHQSAAPRRRANNQLAHRLREELTPRAK